MMNITFKEKSTLGGGWSLEVLRAPLLIGHVRKAGSSSSYQYYHGRDNQLNYEFQEADLEILKRKVSEKYGR